MLSGVGQFQEMPPPIIPHDLLWKNKRLRSITWALTTATELPGDFFKGLYNLVMIDLRQNRLRTLPSFKDQKFASYIRFQENEIEDVLPETFGELPFLDYFYSDANKVLCYQGLDSTTGKRRIRVNCDCPEGYSNFLPDGTQADDVCVKTTCPLQIPGLAGIATVVGHGGNDAKGCPTAVGSSCSVRCVSGTFGPVAGRVYRCDRYGQWLPDGGGPIQCSEALMFQPEYQLVLNEPIFLPLPRSAIAVEFDSTRRWNTSEALAFLTRCVVRPSLDMLTPTDNTKYGQYGIELELRRSESFDANCRESFQKYERRTHTMMKELDEGEIFDTSSGA